MARKKNYTLDEVLRSLAKKRDVRVDSNVKVVQVLTGLDRKFPAHNDLGNGSWGKIDFLCNYQGYRQIFVDRF